MKPRFWIFLILFAFLALPNSALANAGTPLMWAEMLHLVPEKVVVYFISATDGSVYKRPLVGGTQTKERELLSTNADVPVIEQHESVGRISAGNR